MHRASRTLRSSSARQTAPASAGLLTARRLRGFSSDVGRHCRPSWTVSSLQQHHGAPQHRQSQHIFSHKGDIQWRFRRPSPSPRGSTSSRTRARTSAASNNGDSGSNINGWLLLETGFNAEQLGVSTDLDAI
eukprot:scaffold201116_cov30-Prasinocladus_malaysianus.AAC.1